MKVYTILKNIAKKVSLDYVHPVGEIYTTTDSSFNPNKTWGGSWEQLTADAYFKIVTENGGSLDGTASDHKIPITSMPSHTHEDNRYLRDANLQGGWGSPIQNVSASTYRAMISTSGGNPSGSGQAYYPYYYGVYAWHRTA